MSNVTLSYRRFTKYTSHNSFTLCHIDRECGAICDPELPDRTEGKVKGSKINARGLPMRYAVLLLIIVLFIPACAAPVAASTNEVMTPPIAAEFDSNHNNMIEKNEAIDAVTAYSNGGITRGQAIDIIILYFSGGPIQEQVAPPSLAEVIAQVRPAVVKIHNNTARSQGSGVIFKTEGQNGYVVTNQHVVRSATTVRVTVQDKDPYYTGDVMGVDSMRDLAVVRICCASDFPTATFGDSEQLSIGDQVFTVGYPVDSSIPRSDVAQPKVIVDPNVVTATVTMGIVSAVRYDSENDRQLIQTDAPLNPGNSGGPLFALDGGVIGINTFTLRGTEGLNFAVLETTVQEQLPTLQAGGAPPEPARPEFEFVTYAGPWPGHIHHDASNSFFEPVYSNIRKADVIASAWIMNPYDGSEHPFSHGFVLRSRAGSPYFVFVVRSSGAWAISKWIGTGYQEVASGLAPGLDTGARQSNLLAAAAIGEYGWLFLNGELLTDNTGESVFRLGPETHSGWVGLLTGYWRGTEQTGAITHFSDFYGKEVVIHRLASTPEDALRIAEAHAEGMEASQELGHRHLQAEELE